MVRFFFFNPMERFKIKCRSSTSSSPILTSSLFSIVLENKLYIHMNLLLIFSHIVACHIYSSVTVNNISCFSISNSIVFNITIFFFMELCYCSLLFISLLLDVFNLSIFLRIVNITKAYFVSKASSIL